MTKSCLCKLCAKPLTVEVDDDYAALGDHLKLIPMATCNQCYDLFSLRRKLHDSIFRCAVELIQLGAKISDVQRAKISEALTKLTKQYAKLEAEYYRRPNLQLWDDQFPQLIMDQPQKWGAIVQEYRKTYRSFLKERTA